MYLPLNHIHTKLISTFLLLSLGLCLRPIVSAASALAWFNRYICNRNLQFLSNIIIDKTKIFLPPAKMTLADF